jgi:hypothetical protein
MAALLIGYARCSTDQQDRPLNATDSPHSGWPKTGFTRTTA